MRRLAIVMIFALSISCAPTLQRANVAYPEEYLFAEGFSQDSCTLGLRWWEIFADTTLNRIMERAVVNNRDLKATFTNVEAARSYIKIARAEFLPSISINGEVEAYRINGVTTKEYTAVPTISWEISLFGAMRSSRDSAKEEYLSEEWGYRAAILSLTSEVATTLFTLGQYRRSCLLAERSYLLRQQATALVDSMHRYGMSDGIALARARSLVYSAESEVEKYRRAVEQTTMALNILLGDTPESPINIGSVDVQIPEIPVGLPSEMLCRRPDVMSAYHTMLSCEAKVRLARANRFPSISLTGESGLISYTLKDLRSEKPLGWSIAGSLSQPIFSFGTLRRREKIAEQEYLSALYDYEGVTLQALSDVEKALIGITTFRNQLDIYASLIAANEKIERSTSALYRSGMGDYLSVIDAQRELFASQIDYEQLRMEQLTTYVSLIKALGGGW